MPPLRLFRHKKFIPSVTWERTPLVQQVYYDEDGRHYRGEAPYLLPKDDKEIQRLNYAKHIGQVMEAAVEGYNSARGQVIGRSSQNKTVNFTTAQPISPAPGSYIPVRITHSHPNSLVGEAVSQ